MANTFATWITFRLRALATACTMVAALSTLTVWPANADGGEIAYIAQDQASIHLVEADGTGDRQLLAVPDVTALAWAPDGKTLAYLKGIVFSNGFHGSQQLFLYNTTTGQSTEVKNAGFTGAVAFFPDGKRLVGQYGTVDRLCEGGLGVLDTTTGTGGPLNLVVGCMGQMQVAPDGAHVIASGQVGGDRDSTIPQEVWDIDLTSEQPTLLPGPAEGSPFGVVGAVSPDNKTLASLVVAGSDSTPAAVELHVADRDGSNPRTTWQLPASGAASITFAPDGAEVAAAVAHTNHPGYDIWVVGIDGSTPHQVASGWSPDWRPGQTGSGTASAQVSVIPTSAPSEASPAGPATETTGAAVPDTLTSQVKADLLAAVDRANSAWAAASRSLDPSDLNGAVAGQELVNDTAELDALRSRRLTRKNINTAFSVIAVSVDAPGSATVYTHESWYAETYDIGTGKLVQRTPPATYDETYGLAYQDGGWIVIRNDLS